MLIVGSTSRNFIVVVAAISPGCLLAVFIFPLDDIRTTAIQIG